MIPPTLTTVVTEPLVRNSSRIFGTYPIDTYSHEIRAFGGYWSANFTIHDEPLDLTWWIQNGLGSDVKVYDDALVPCWVGFIDQLQIKISSLSIVVGPLMDTANRVVVMYNGIENTEYPAISIGQIRTAEANDTTSQTKYGILPKILSASDITEDEGDGYRDTYLEQMKNPKVSTDFNIKRDIQPSVEVSCLGYVHWLDYPYSDADTGGQALSSKIIDILSATPNSAWLPFNTDNIDANATIVTTEQDDQNKTGLNIIKSLVALGDSSYNRWLFAIYNDFKAYYHTAPTEVEYQQWLTDPTAGIFTTSNALVNPWNVLPGKWIRYPDLAIGSGMTGDLTTKAQYQFIESAKYTAPWGLQLKGGEVGTLAQRMAQFGLGGTS